MKVEDSARTPRPRARRAPPARHFGRARGRWSRRGFLLLALAGLHLAAVVKRRVVLRARESGPHHAPRVVDALERESGRLLRVLVRVQEQRHPLVARLRGRRAGPPGAGASSGAAAAHLQLVWCGATVRVKDVIVALARGNMLDRRIGRAYPRRRLSRAVRVADEGSKVLP